MDKDAKEMVRKAARRQVQVERRALEVFSQMLKIPQFKEWMEKHIIIRDEVDEEKKTITTYVIYKEEKSDDSGNGAGEIS